jgi:hypothetical protein
LVCNSEGGAVFKLKPESSKFKAKAKKLTRLIAHQLTSLSANIKTELYLGLKIKFES